MDVVADSCSEMLQETAVHILSQACVSSEGILTLFTSVPNQHIFVELLGRRVKVGKVSGQCK